jgi:hypothetical protein
MVGLRHPVGECAMPNFVQTAFVYLARDRYLKGGFPVSYRDDVARNCGV